MKDLSYALRMLRKNPGFTAVAIAALALGIGATSAMFSILYSILLRNLPFQQPDRLVMVWQPAPLFGLKTQYIAASPADFYDWETQNRTFAYLAGFAARQANLSRSGRPESVHETLVTGDFFSVFGVPPLLGAPIRYRDQSPNSTRVAVLSYRFWKDRFNGDRGVIGRNIRLDGQDYQVIGIMSREFRFPEGNEMPALYGFPPTTDIWIPAGFSQANWSDRDNHTLLVIGRLKPGITAARAQADLQSIQESLARIYPANDQNFRAFVTPLMDIVAGPIRTELLLLFAAVGFVLLIACANVANLLLARATARQREIAVRLALGAPRRRLFRQLLMESVALSFLGSVAGLLLAAGLLRVVLALAPGTIPRLQTTTLDWQVVVFAIALGFLTGILFGCAPAVQLLRRDVNESLQDAAGKGSVGTGRSKTRKLLVISQVSLTMLLLVGAGLGLRSLLAVEGVNPGFESQHVITADVVLPSSKYKSEQQRRMFFQQALRRVEELPGVERAGLVSALPLSRTENLGGLQIQGKTVPGDHITAERRWVSEGYFRALGVPLLAGRDFEPFDGNAGWHSAIVNEEVVRRFFQRENPIGKQVNIGHGWLRIVGVVGDVHNTNLETSPRLQVYLYYASGTPQAMSFVVRSPESPGEVAASLRRAIATVDPDQSIADVRTMDQLLNGSVAARRFGSAIIAIFGSLALLLTVVGLYGVMNYNVTQRSREIGLRMALGATQSEVLGIVLRQALAMTCLGIAFGAIGAMLGSGFAAGFVFGVPARDPVTICAIAAILVAVAVVAAYVPARRAASTDPSAVLRTL